MFLILFGRAAQFVLVLAIMRIATSILTPEEMGRMSLVISITAFFAVLLVYHVGMFINRRLHAWNAHGQVKRYFGYYGGYLLLVSFVAAASLVLVKEIGAVSFTMGIAWLVVLVCGSLLFNTANQTLIPSLNLLEFRGWFIGLTLLTIATGFFFSLLLVSHFEPTAEYWLLGQIIGQALIAIVGAKIFFDRVAISRKAETGIKRKQIAAVLAFAWPVAISVGLNWVQTQGYRFFMEDIAGLAALGLFVAGYGVSAGLIVAIETILTTYFQPQFYKKITGGTRHEQSVAWNEYARAMLPSIVLTGIFIVSLAPEITRILLGPAFQPAHEFVVWGACAEVLRAATGVYGLVAHARMNTRLLLLPHATGAGIAVVLVWWLLPLFGAAGAGAALVAAGASTLIAMYFFMRKQMDMSLAPRRLILSLLLGVGIIVLTAVARWLAGSNGGLWVSFTVVALPGVVFLAFQVLLLYPSLRTGEEAK